MNEIILLIIVISILIFTGCDFPPITDNSIISNPNGIDETYRHTKTCNSFEDLLLPGLDVNKYIPIVVIAKKSKSALNDNAVRILS